MKTKEIDYKTDGKNPDMAIPEQSLDAVPQLSAKIDVVLQNISEVVVIINKCGIVIYESDSVEHIFGYAAEKLLGSSLYERVHPDDRLRLEQKIDEIIHNSAEKITTDYRLLHSDGRWLHVSILMENREDQPEFGGILCYIKDQTDFKRIQERAYYFEFNDPLTGLPNKEMFVSILQRKLKRAEPRKNIFAVMSLGINQFKHINNMYGTKVGDEVLFKIGRRLKAVFRKDDIVSRIEGDHFLILLADLSKPQRANSIFHKVAEVLSRPVRVWEHQIHIAAGIGICFYPQDGISHEQLVKNSEAAMFAAKSKAGTAYSLYDEKQNQELLWRITTEQQIHNAFQNSEFCLYYQPKIDLWGELVGMEALVRWESPSRGLVPPSVFIPIMEENGLIVQLGKIILKEACLQNKRWQEMGFPPIPVSVNISSVEFGEEDLVSHVRQILDSTGMNPQWLEIEVTESGIMENEEECIRKLIQIHNMGVAVSIDDFGTGYSSLSKLKDYPVDTLKIDKAFVEDLPDDYKSMVLAESIIALGHHLGFRVIAEGVENCKQFYCLQEKGCDYFQGYYFSQPVNTENFERLLEEKDFSYKII